MQFKVWDVNFWAELALTITGHIDYAGDYTGRVYLLLRFDTESETDLGTSVAADNFPVDFTIRGVRPGTYFVEAYLDIQGYGEAHAASPRGNSTSFSVNTTDVDVGTFYLADVNPPELASVEGVNAMPGDQVAFLMWGVQTDEESRVVPEYYNIYYGTEESVGPDNTTGGGSILDVLAAEDFGNYLVDGLQNGTTYYFVLEACNIDGCTDPSPVSAPTVIGDPSSGHTVSGQVLFSGIEPTGPLWIAIFGMAGDEPDFSNMRVNKMDITSNPQPFSVAGVPDGEFVVFPLVDMNNNNQVGPGDVTPDDGPDGDPITVSGADVVVPIIPVAITNLYVSAETRHHKNLGASWEDYAVDLDISSGIKLPVKVTLVEGKGALAPKDIGKRWDFYTWVYLDQNQPLLGDSYVFEVEYSDGTQGTIALPVTGVLNAFATPTAPIGNAPDQTEPTFTWTQPDNPPAWYTYELNIWEDMGSNVWYTEDIPQNATSVPFNFDGQAEQVPLTAGQLYNWEIIVQDAHGNKAVMGTSFTP